MFITETLQLSETECKVRIQEINCLIIKSFICIKEQKVGNTLASFYEGTAPWFP